MYFSERGEEMRNRYCRLLSRSTSHSCTSMFICGKGMGYFSFIMAQTKEGRVALKYNSKHRSCQPIVYASPQLFLGSGKPSAWELTPPSNLDNGVYRCLKRLQSTGPFNANTIGSSKPRSTISPWNFRARNEYACLAYSLRTSYEI
jgi:hypothetical protein